jgi:hypothetical protein
MNCTQCKIDLPVGSKFCPECGTPASQTMQCAHCGEPNPPSAKFCQACGKSLKPAPAPGESPGGAAAPSEDQTSFAFLLSEEKLRSVNERPVRIPYGCAAVVLVDGVVTRVQTQVPSKLEAPGAIGNFFSRLADGALALMGQRRQDVRTWIISDFRQLPLITYSHPLALPAAPDARLRFEFWLDAHDNPSEADLSSMGVFFQRVLAGRPQISNEEFRKAAIQGLQAALAQLPDAALQETEKQQEVLNTLKRTTGISGKCVFLKGRNPTRRYLEVGAIHEPVACKGCGCEYGREYMNKLKFCEECGTSMAGLDWIGASTYLQAADGKALVMRLSVLTDAGETFDEAAVARAVIGALRPILARKDVATLLEGAELTALAAELNRDLARTFKGSLSDFAVLDLKLADQDWIFKTDALIDEEIRKIEAQQKMLAVESRDLDYRDAAFAIRLRGLAQEDGEAVAERRAALESRRSHAALEVEEHRLQARTDLDIARVDADVAEQRSEMDHAAAQREFERQRQNLVRDRDLNRVLRREDQTDEIERASHEMQLEKQVARHDIELGDLVGESQSRARRREITDQVFEAEEALRLRAQEREQLGRIDEDLADRQNLRQIDKMRAMAELEANMAKQDQEFELNKMQNLKGLDAAQILAMQAAQLVKAGGEQSAVEIVKSIAESQAVAANSASREDLYAKMLEMKEQAARTAIDSQRAAMEAIMSTNAELARVASTASATANEGYREAARIAQSTNEKSMDSMHRVASVAAGRKPAETRLFNCQKCSASYEGKKKFCPQCGAPQQQPDE